MRTYRVNNKYSLSHSVKILNTSGIFFALLQILFWVMFLARIKRDAVFFFSGGVGYGIIELMWRGKTHWTMLIAGGMCFIIFSRIAERFKSRSMLFKAFLCSASVTVVEFVFGIAFNVILKMSIWDYSKMPFNFLGQICLMYTVLWGVLGYLFVPVAEMLNRKLDKSLLG